MRRRTTRRGFTLIELMIVVGIIGLLASVAIPTFTLLVARTRRAEQTTQIQLLLRDATYKFRNDGFFSKTGGAYFNPSPGNFLVAPGKKLEMDWTKPTWRDAFPTTPFSHSSVRFRTFMLSSNFMAIFSYHDFDRDGKNSFLLVGLLADPSGDVRPNCWGPVPGCDYDPTPLE